MAFIVCKLARAAVASSRAAVGGCSRPVSPCLPRHRQLYLTARRMCSGVITPGPDAAQGYQMEPIPPGPQELIVTAEILESDEALWAMYEYWRKYYGISRDSAEMNYRFNIFKRTARFVHKSHNSGISCVGMNLFADQTIDELTRPRCW